MKTSTHVEALAELARSIRNHTSEAQVVSSISVIAAFANQLGMEIKSYQFTRILTWVIAFYYDALEIVEKSSLSEKTRALPLPTCGSFLARYFPLSVVM